MHARHHRSAAAVLAAGLTLTVTAACGQQDAGSVAATTPATTTSSAPPPQPQPTTGPAVGFETAGFSDPTRVDNRWFPLVVGTKMVYRGQTIEDGEVMAHGVEFTVTDLTKTVAGVEAVVVLELDFSAGDLEEAELAMFAQADDGTVWHLGQYPEVYEDGRVVEHPAWVHGVKEAQAGITIRADDQPGAGSYSQGWGPEVGWSDRARVIETGQRVCVVAGCFDDVKVTEESSDDEPGAFQHKYYGPGVGNVKVGWAGDDPTRETLELVSVEKLDAGELASARGAALKLEKSGFTRSPDVWGTTGPAG
jgi:hypothetical protein